MEIDLPGYTCTIQEKGAYRVQIRIRSKSRTIWLFIAASLVFHAALFFGLRELKPDLSEGEPQGPLKIRSLLIPEWEREEGAARAAQAEEQEERQEQPREQEEPRPEEQPDRSRREAPAEERPDAAERPEADPESRVAEALGGWDPDLGTGFEGGERNGRGPGGRGGEGEGGAKNVPFSRLSEGRDLEVPEYPELARKWGWQGVVVLRIDVGPGGEVLGTEVIESSGYEILDKAAVDTVESAWSFRPPGEFVSTIKEIEFVLREGS